MNDGEDDDDQPPQGERQRQRSRSRERVYPHVPVPQEPQIQPVVTPESDDEISDDEMTNNFSNIHIEVPKGVDGRIRDVLEECMTTCGKAAGNQAKRRSRAKKEASAKEVRGYYKQLAEAKHLEYKSWVDDEVFDLVI